MENHLNGLIRMVPDLLQKNILDLGSGRGGFMLAVLKRGGRVTGLELYDKYIEQTKSLLDKENLKAEVLKGTAENLPFRDGEFDFININGVIEHVVSPQKMMSEAARVLAKDGRIYIDVPNRFGLKDQHFHLYFANWMPRVCSDFYVSLVGRDKDYSINNGLQKLSQMHYYTYGQAKKLFAGFGFKVSDIREMKIKQKFTGIKKVAALVAYKILRPWYFDSVHILLERK